MISTEPQLGVMKLAAGGVVHSTLEAVTAPTVTFPPYTAVDAISVGDPADSRLPMMVTARPSEGLPDNGDVPVMDRSAAYVQGLHSDMYVGDNAISVADTCRCVLASASGF